MSLPAWGVWVETFTFGAASGGTASLPAWGVWVETFFLSFSYQKVPGHSPHGECGLKPEYFEISTGMSTSLPAWGVWVETRNSFASISSFSIVTPRMGSVG